MRAALLVFLPCLLAGRSQGQNLTGWRSHRGKDCYRGAGGDPMDPDPYSRFSVSFSFFFSFSCRSLGLPACLKACGVGCSAVVVRSGGGELPVGECYRRSRVLLGQCVQDSAWDWCMKSAGKSRPNYGWN